MLNLTIKILLGILTALSIYALYDTLTYKTRYGLSYVDDGEDIWNFIFEFVSIIIYGYMFLKATNVF